MILHTSYTKKRTNKNTAAIWDDIFWFVCVSTQWLLFSFASALLSHSLSLHFVYANIYSIFIGIIFAVSVYMYYVCCECIVQVHWNTSETNIQMVAELKTDQCSPYWQPVNTYYTHFHSSHQYCGVVTQLEKRNFHCFLFITCSKLDWIECCSKLEFLLLPAFISVFV